MSMFLLVSLWACATTGAVPTPIQPAPAPLPIAAPPAQPPPNLNEPLAADSFRVRLTTSDTGVNTVELVCAEGFRARSPLYDGLARTDGLPDGDCTLYFKGGVPAQFSPVHGGQDLRCNIQGTTAVCSAMRPVTPPPLPATPAAAPPDAPATPPPAPLEVRLFDVSDGTNAVELVCDELRQRQDLVHGVALFDPVSAAQCDLYFKGGAPLIFRGAHPGDKLECHIVSTTAVCTSVPEPATLQIQGLGTKSVQITCPSSGRQESLTVTEGATELPTPSEPDCVLILK